VSCTLRYYIIVTSLVDTKYLFKLDEEINQYTRTGLKWTDKLAEERNDDII
jgi:hypothetical protein